MGKLQDMLAKYSKLGYYDKFDYHWGMTIDLDRCSGCEACVVACQAENNLPIVGEQLIKEGKEVRWLRIERYWQGEYPNAKLSFLPMLCQHCDQAPCETVCPVSATYHNQDGLNTQVYNRCIGTRTCAVYCTYDVRYFNWFTHTWDEPLEQQLNPDVTVRERGVMEKCTFCAQRIQEAKSEAARLGVPMADGDIKVACQQSCPTQAIVFGDMNDPESAVSKLSAKQRAYGVLTELNVQPSVSYLARVRNVEELEHSDSEEDHG